jgi:hypothetical protein
MSAGTELLDELAMKAVVSRLPHRAATVGHGVEQAATATSRGAGVSCRPPRPPWLS